MRIRRSVASSLVLAAAVAAVAAPAGSGWVRVSVDATGGAPSGGSYECAVTPNGRFVAFYSDADDLLGDPGNGSSDVFVRDVRAGTNHLVSRTPAGTEGNAASRYPSISNNGRWVVFQSSATDLVEGATGSQIYAADRATGEVRLVSEGYEGGPADGSCDLYGLSLSGNGRWAVFRSNATNLVEGVDTHGYYQVYLRDLRSGTTTLVSRDRDDPLSAATGTCLIGSISPNGRFVVFPCNSANLVPGNSNGIEHVYRADLRKRTMVRASVDPSGVLADSGSYDPVVSNNGRWVAFYSGATNLDPTGNDPGSDVFLKDLSTGALVLASPSATTAGSAYSPALSASGKVLVFYSEQSGLVEGDGNGTGDVFRYDPKTGAVSRLSVDAAGNEGNGYTYMCGPSLSSNGKWLVVTTQATNLPVPPEEEDSNYDVLLRSLK